MATPSVTFKVKFRPSLVEDHPGSIIYVVTYRRVSRQFTPDFKLYPSEWDKRRECILVTGDVLRREILSLYTRRIKNDTLRVKSIVMKYAEELQEYTVDDIICELQSQIQHQSFFEYMNAVIARLVKLNPH